MKTMLIAALTAGLIPGCGAGSAAAASHAIVVSDAWSRPVPAGLPTGVVYLTIANRGRTPDRLMSASTPVAAHLDLHRSSMKAGVMSMETVPGGIAIPPGAVVRVAPNGYHLMMTGLNRGLAAGTHFPVTLTFVHAGPVRAQVQVRAAPPEPAMAGMRMR